ncbi:MAG: SDR family NAD(P)-dependent oxidoreductase, partial [Armatimonadota bacterium]
MTLTGKVAVITGASGDLGSVVVERFVASGATVVAVTHSAPSLLPGVALTLQADVSDEAQVEQLMATVNTQLGGPHLLLNLVGGWAGGQKVHELDLATWDH